MLCDLKCNYEATKTRRTQVPKYVFRPSCSHLSRFRVRRVAEKLLCKVGQAFGEAIPLELACQFQTKNVTFGQTGMSDPPAKGLLQQLAGRDSKSETLSLSSHMAIQISRSIMSLNQSELILISISTASPAGPHRLDLKRCLRRSVGRVGANTP